MNAAIERTLDIEASPERVWQAITDPLELAQWFPDEVSGLTAQAGAEGWLGWRAHGRFAVRFEVVEPPRRLVWTWCRDADTPVDEGVVTRVEWRLEARTGGGTRLHLRESGFATEAHRKGNEDGWTSELKKLVSFVERPAPQATVR